MPFKQKLKRISLIPIKLAKTLKNNGPKETAKRIRNSIRQFIKSKSKPRTYKDYLRDRSKEIKSISDNLQYKPSFKVFVLKNSNENIIRTKKSFEEQIYKHFESIEVNSIDEINQKLKETDQEYFTIIKSGDTVFPDYLYEIAKNLNENREADLVYSDEEYVRGENREHFFKPDVSLYTLTSMMYLGHPIFRTKSAAGLNFFDDNFEETFEWDLALRLLESNPQNYIHISKIVYSNFNNPILGKESFSNKYEEESLKLIENYLKRNKISADVEKGFFSGSVKIQRKVLKQNQKVIIIIPTYNNWKVLDNCIRSIEEKSSHKNFEILIINNNSNEPESLDYFKKSKYQVLDLPIPFNFSKINNEGFKEINKKVKSDYVLFLNNDTEVLQEDWLESFISLAQNKEIGMVGPKLLYPDNTIQHAGLVMGINGIAAHGLKGLHDKDNGYFGQANILREVSAITGAAIFMRTEVFEEIGMFDEKYTIAFQDLDLSMKVIDKGYKIIYTPFIKLYHYESKTRGKVPHPVEYQDGSIFINRWGNYVHNGDPFYNRNLTLDREDFGIR